ncbi:bifunctional proline dehydrogenase/L-glutamate gamma-semialdehyde dehydrogenase PutA [Pseudooceanicola onchidii]|uniref:bifunctional proline dehydrogenase/L-glutamate gamma-semialdehyde dehydrogenase PutA n=1 Tax=Pseudooceanicola onchidii TaxID=2562279 RepID=UPI001F0F6DB2|nr:bifunctional proline dehydrogenase/L-glutamate gamma-semialdehyde dehydrogenase PutA [Pseudooceanicola onchidii]
MTADLTAFTPDAKFADEARLTDQLIANSTLTPATRQAIHARAVDLITKVRNDAAPSPMEAFLTEYGLSTQEGVALMCLAEAMLRVPDTQTMEALIEDKIAPSDWGQHLGAASSSLVNASTWALMLTGRVLDDRHPGVSGVVRGAIKRLGEPVIRVAVGQAMKVMGRQFVLGEAIAPAMSRARGMEAKGYTYSYDMLGEAAITGRDAERYFQAYSNAMAEIARACSHADVAENPGISIKLSALHPRYEVAQETRVMDELVPRVLDLARQAKAAGMGLNIDAEEQDRLVLSLKVIRAVLSSPDLAGWDGFGVVVQAYGKRAGLVIDWLGALATQLDRRIMVRLVKGAYWDTEIKHAQVEGLPGFTVFTTKPATDVSYIALAEKLFSMADRIYPQFATHNAHTVAAILEMGQGQRYEFQRLHGMGESLHDIVHRAEGTRCRIYAPVGKHSDLLAYLVRRLLENGANSSFVHQIVNPAVTPETIATDPFDAVRTATSPAGLVPPQRIFGARENSRGWDLTDDATLAAMDRTDDIADVTPRTLRPATGTEVEVLNPATGAAIATVREADAETVDRAIADARLWAAPVATRADTLRRAADLYEANADRIFGILAREAGKTLPDAVGELREAVDFLRFYADEAERKGLEPAGIFAAISPWNFPLAIFTGQIAAALAVGNAVLAKPAEATPVIAALAVDLLHEAGVPRDALQLLTGRGGVVGAALSSDPRIAGVVFTGSTATAKTIRRAMADTLAPGAPLIAETGGLNAMMVDSTALPEQAVTDIITSAFQSAGQRCSALRCLYLQEDVADHILTLLKGAMDELTLGDPWHLSTDVGPVIDQAAHDAISAYVDAARRDGRVLHEVASPGQGFVAPVILRVAGIADMEREVFGPVLHVATFRSRDRARVIDDINAMGYGLTFGLHTRIDSRVQEVTDTIHVGNLYVNRNQIGAIVGSQPFGGEGLSGTGPKAGGPNYLKRFARAEAQQAEGDWQEDCDPKALAARIADAPTGTEISRTAMPGPTGEDNTLTLVARGPILCAGPGPKAAAAQVAAVEALGGIAVSTDGHLAAGPLETLAGIEGVLWWGPDPRPYAQALARRDGAILPLITGLPDLGHVAHERHVCIDTTASGGNAALLAG